MVRLFAKSLVLSYDPPIRSLGSGTVILPAMGKFVQKVFVSAPQLGSGFLQQPPLILATNVPQVIHDLSMPYFFDISA